MTTRFTRWIERRLTHTITLAPPAGETGYGGQAEGAATTVDGRITPITAYRRAREGVDVEVAASLLVPVDAAITAGTRVTYDGVDYIALRGGPLPDVDGAMMFQKWELGSA